MIISICVCVAALGAVIWLLRRDRVSLGLPIAYLYALLLIHVPGAIAHVVGAEILRDSQLTELGIAFTAVGAVAYVVGVWLGRMGKAAPEIQTSVPSYLRRAPADADNFSWFCLVGGWIFTYGLSPLRSIPSLGAAVEKAGAVWMLGVMLGLRDALQRSDLKRTVIWCGALVVYPVLMLLLGGFLSYGSTAMIIVTSILAVSTRSHWKVAVGTVIAAVLSFHIFLSYFQNRDQIRESVWGGAGFEQRIDASLNMISDFGLFDPTSEQQLTSIDLRLNQNYFAGLAATRINNGDVDYLYGRSLWEGILALVPRALWPEKPVSAGSPKVVMEMTGLILDDTTSFGVGNVMEFQINFGIPGLIAGFGILGWALGRLDKRAAEAEARGDLAGVFVFFLPAVALIQPNGSVVELMSGSLAAYVGAIGWRIVWKQWVGRQGTAGLGRPNAQRRP